MKKIIDKKLIMATILAIFCHCKLEAQYSNYYNVNSQSNSNVNANVKHNVSGMVSIQSTQTIKNIDYGALALANAQRERNNIEQQKITDEKQRKNLSEVILDPVKAYDYGSIDLFNLLDKKYNKNDRKRFQEASGLKGYIQSTVLPIYFFSPKPTGGCQNISSDGVVTNLDFSFPHYNEGNIKFNYEEDFEKSKEEEGTEVEGVDDNNVPTKYFVHRTDLNRAYVVGASGYRTTTVWEDKFEYGITDYYQAFINTVGNGFEVQAWVRYHGDKDEITFEQLEGRRYYLKGLIEKVIGSQRIYDIKLLN